MRGPARPSFSAERRPRLARALACVAAVSGVHGLLLTEAPWPRHTQPRASVAMLLVPPTPVHATEGPAAPPPGRDAAAQEPAPVVKARIPATARPRAAAKPAAATPTVEAMAEPATVVETVPDRTTAAPRPTRVPPSMQLHYRLQRGAASGEARLSWRVDGERYALDLQALLPQGRELEQRSQGAFDAAGLAPLRLADRRRGRDVRAANFQREHGKITFSGPSWELPLHGGAQDRLSWLVQLVALAGAAPDGLREGDELSMWVVGTRGATGDWRFEVRGRQRLSTANGEAETLWLVREPAHPYDIRVELWLDPARGHWPLRLRQTQVPGGEPLEWMLRDDPAPGT